MDRRSAPGPGVFKGRCHPLALPSDPRSSCCRGYGTRGNDECVCASDKIRRPCVAAGRWGGGAVQGSEQKCH